MLPWSRTARYPRRENCEQPVRPTIKRFGKGSYCATATFREMQDNKVYSDVSINRFSPCYGQLRTYRSLRIC